MVSKVLEWKRANPEKCLQVWSALNESNMKLTNALLELNALSSSSFTEYETLIKNLSFYNSNEILQLEGDNVEYLQNVIESLSDIRKYLKIMTLETGVSIEPDEQSNILDAVCKVKGVLGGVVPGAGGYDAICMLVASAEVANIVASTRLLQECEHVRWMSLSEQSLGLIEENVADFSGLV